MFSISFGKKLYGKISPGFGGGKPVAVKLLVDQKNIPFLEEIQIKVDKNMSENVFLLFQTDGEMYIKFLVNNKNERVVQLYKELIRGVIYVK
jgi:hypothetical protein